MNWTKRLLFFAVVTIIAGNPLTVSAASFDAFKGSWRGLGTVKPFKGDAESIRCKVTNSGAGNSLAIALTCASPSYKFSARGSLVSSGNSVSGKWSISDPPKSGSLSGGVSGSVIRVQLHGAGANAHVTVSASAGSLSIAFLFDSGSVNSIVVGMRKR